MKKIGKYSFGIGDRFMKEGVFQLSAFTAAKKQGTIITPVWNKSQREHSTVGTKPDTTREEADSAVKALGWNEDYFVDADHITFETVDSFIPHSDFFTIDIADQINSGLEESELSKFRKDYHPYLGELQIDGLEEPFVINEEKIANIGKKYLKALNEAARIYHKIQKNKTTNQFTIEVSIDEVDQPQPPEELFFILKILADLNIPIQTIAPKFTGRFNKGIDYEGDLPVFERQFEACILIVKHCIKNYGLPETLKLSVHTGSDKFSLYPVINKLIKKHDVGLHLKTAGTTWLEEAIGLAQCGGSAYEMIKRIYGQALDRYDELTGPYGTVLNIDKSKLPTKGEVSQWNSQKFADSLIHEQENADYNPSFRQLIHTAYKIAAENKEEFINHLKTHKEVVGKRVLENIFQRHMKPLYL